MSGNISLNGFLNLSLLGNFIPSAGDTFTILNNLLGSPVTGTFVTLDQNGDLVPLDDGAIVTTADPSGLNPNGWSFVIHYNVGPDSDVTLTALPRDPEEINTAVTVVSSSNYTSDGDSVTFTATVSASDSSVPTGTVSFFDGAAALGSPVSLNEAGSAVFTTNALAHGDDDITALYAGINGSYAPAVSDPITAQVGENLWVGLGGDNDWNDAANWVRGDVPTSSDDVDIPAGYTVNISSGTVSVQSLLCAGTLNVTGGTLSLSDMSTVTNTGSIALSPGTTLELNDGAMLLNYGSISLSDGSAVTSATSDGSFDNEGTFSIASSATATVGVAFINDSSISGSSGSLTFQSADFTMLDGSSVQAVTFDDEALYLAYGDSATATDSTFTDTTFDGGGTLTLSGTPTISGTNTWSVDLDVSGTLDLSSGTLTLNDAATIGTLNLSGGTLTGSGDISVSDAFNWTGGTLAGAGQFTIPGANLSASGTLVLDGATLVNNGSVTVESDTTLEIDDAATVVNNDDFSVDSGAALTSATSDGSFDNEGTFNGGGTVGIAVTNDGYAADLTFTNDVTLLDGSSVDAVSFEYNTLYLSSGATASAADSYFDSTTISGNGTLELSGTSTFDNVNTWASGLYVPTELDFSSGTLDIGGASTIETLDLSGGTLSFGGASTIDMLYLTGGTLNVGGTSTIDTIGIDSGTLNVGGAATIGSIDLSGGAVSFGHATTISSLEMSGGTISGAGAVTLTDSLYASGGTLAGTGQFTIGSGTTAEIDASTFIVDGQSIVNNGTIEVDGSANLELDSGAALVNNGSLVLDSSSSVYNESGSASLDNEGSITGSGAIVGIAVTNEGSIDGAIALASGSFTFVNESSTANISFNDETLYLASGHTADGSGLTFTSTTLDGGGTLHLSGTTVFLGTNTWTANVTNYGTLDIGDSGSDYGTLAITGNFTNDSGGTLNVQLGGTTAGSSYDQLTVSGAASLDGTLNIAVASGYTPGSSDTFSPVTYASSTGSFATINGLDQGSYSFTTSYDSSAFTLGVSS